MIEIKMHPSGLIVFNDGRVLVPENYNKKAHITIGSISGSGYPRVKYKQKMYDIHRLVAECFIPNPDDLPCVNHKDEDKTNNYISNLEWCTYKYNSNYGTAIQRRVEKQSKPVLQFTLNDKFVKEYPSFNEVKSQTGFDGGNICSCCRGKRQTAYGFKWVYKQNETA